MCVMLSLGDSPQGEALMPIFTKKNNSQGQTEEAETMVRPSSYFSIREHAFTVKGRKANKGVDSEVHDLALFYEGELLLTPKPLRLSSLRDLVPLLSKGYNEEITSILIAESGQRELALLLKDQKISCLDFLAWLKEQLKGAAKLPKAAKGGNRLLPIIRVLTSLAPNLSPEALVNELSEALSEEGKKQSIIEALEARLAKNGRDGDGFILMRPAKKPLK